METNVQAPRNGGVCSFTDEEKMRGAERVRPAEAAEHERRRKTKTAAAADRGRGAEPQNLGYIKRLPLRGRGG